VTHPTSHQAQFFFQTAATANVIQIRQCRRCSASDLMLRK
jgi:hypothetical protein